MATPSIAMIPSGYKDGKIYSVLPNSVDGDFTFSRGSAATRVNEQGLVEEITDTDIPRLDYTDGSCPSLLLEPQSTNLITYSEDFSGYIKSGINIVSNIATSPDGTVNATSLTNTTTGQSHIRTSFVAASTGNYTGTSYIKKQDFDFIYVELGNAFCWFNISNGTLGNSGNFGSGWTFISHSIESVGNDWYRFSITANNTITGTYNFRPYQPTSANASYTSGLLGNSFIWGTQVEQLSYATSYIPTNGAIATRLADVATNSGNASLINSTEGVLYAEIAALENGSSIKIIELNDGTSSNRVFVYLRNDRITYEVKSNGITSAVGTYDNLGVLNFHKIAVKWKDNDFALWLDGAKVLSDTSGSSPLALDRINFTDPFGGIPFYGKCKALAVYKEALTDAELQSLTTI